MFKQRVELDTFHGYGVQDFLDVDPRVGTRDDLVELVGAAHDNGIRIILDIIFNHTGANWVYPGDVREPPFRHFPDHYPFGRWLDAAEQPSDAIAGGDDGVWPTELQNGERYTRAGSGSLGAGDVADERAEHKRTDFFSLRDLRLDVPIMLSDLAQLYKYWIALTDCDGFRIDTLKHVSLEQARNFDGAIREFAANLGKLNFLLVGEVAGGEPFQDFYLDGLSRNLSAVLDIGGMRPTLINVSKGLVHPSAYFDAFNAVDPGMGSHRNVGNRHVSIVDDHDMVSGDKVRYATDAASEHQVVAAVAIQAYSLGITMIYSGTEQGFAAPEPPVRQFLPGFRGGDFADRYLREAMFGPVHPRRPGRAGFPDVEDGLDESLPGFGPFGSAGHHCFNANHPAYRRIAALNAVRRAIPALRHGRQYIRDFRLPDRGFAVHGPGEIIPWARILDDEEALVVVNAHGTQRRGGHVLVDRELTPPGTTMTVIANTAQAGSDGPFAGSHPVGSTVAVQQKPADRHSSPSRTFRHPRWSCSLIDQLPKKVACSCNLHADQKRRGPCSKDTGHRSPAPVRRRERVRANASGRPRPQCTSDQIWRFSAYSNPVRTIRKSSTEMPRRLLCSRLGSEAQARKAVTSRDCWSRVAWVPSA